MNTRTVHLYMHLNYTYRPAVMLQRAAIYTFSAIVSTTFLRLTRGVAIFSQYLCSCALNLIAHACYCFVRVIEGSDNRDSDNQGRTVLS